MAVERKSKTIYMFHKLVFDRGAVNVSTNRHKTGL